MSGGFNIDEYCSSIERFYIESDENDSGEHVVIPRQTTRQGSTRKSFVQPITSEVEGKTKIQRQNSTRDRRRLFVMEAIFAMFCITIFVICIFFVASPNQSTVRSEEDMAQLETVDDASLIQDEEANDVSILCDTVHLGKETIRDCQEACLPGACCFAGVETDNCDQDFCATFESCLGLESYYSSDLPWWEHQETPRVSHSDEVPMEYKPFPDGYEPPVVDPHVSKVCHKDNMAYVSTRTLCQDACTGDPMCCFDMNDKKNCFEDSKEWCGSYAPCINLNIAIQGYDPPPEE